MTGSDDHGVAGEQVADGDDRRDRRHAHAHDQGVRGAMRYLRWFPQMWSSEINSAVVDLLDPRSGERVLDIGAGLGPATVAVAKRGATVISVEPTPFLRRILSARRLGQRARDRIEVVDGGAEHLPIADRSVDAALAVNTMHHWIDPSRAAVEIARVLAPDGRLVLVDEDFSDPSHPEFERFGSDDHDAGDDHHGFEMVDAERMGELFRDAGLDVTAAGRSTIVRRPSIVVRARASSGAR